MCKQNNKQNNNSNISDPELMKTIHLQNKIIKKLQDEIISYEQFERDFDSFSKEPGIPIAPGSKFTINTGNKIYKSRLEIPNYEHKYNSIYKDIVTPKNKSTFRLNITNYKKTTDFKTNKDKSMKYLEDLGIKRNETTKKYDMTQTQVDALIEKIVLYHENERIYKL